MKNKSKLGVRKKEEEFELSEIFPKEPISFEILINIFKYLPLTVLFVVRIVSKQWYQSVYFTYDRHPSWLSKVHPKLLQGSDKKPLIAKTIYQDTKQKIANMQGGFFSENSIADIYKSALINGDINVVAQLVHTKQVKVNVLISYYDWDKLHSSAYTPLMIAAKNDHYPLVKFLLDAGADPEYRYSYWTAADYGPAWEAYVHVTDVAKDSSEVHALLYIARAERAIMSAAEKAKAKDEAEKATKAENIEPKTTEDEIKNISSGGKDLLQHAYKYSNRDSIEKYFQDVFATKRGLYMSYTDLGIKIMREWLEEFKEEVRNDKNCNVM